MNSRDIEKRCAHITQLIGDLHEELVQQDDIAVLFLPCVDLIITPNLRAMEVALTIGASACE